MEPVSISKKQNGKGGNIDVRKNPFGARPARQAPYFGDQPDVGNVLDVILSAGCGVILGRTRDGGAVCITVLDGDTRHRTYCANDEELDDALVALKAAFLA